MSKLGLDGKPIFNDKGKVMKGPKYFKQISINSLHDKKQLLLDTFRNSYRDHYLFNR